MASYGRCGYDRSQYDRTCISGIYLVATLNSYSDVNSRLQIEQLLSSALNSDSNVSGTLTIDQFLSTITNSNSAIVADLDWSIGLQVTIPTDSNVSATLTGGSILLSASLGSLSDVEANLQEVIHLLASLGSESDVNVSLAVGQILSASIGSISNTYASFGEAIVLSASIGSESGLNANLIKYATAIFEYGAALGVGETLCIDSNDFTVKIGSTNKLADFDGDFVDIYRGINTFEYEDDETSRTITVAITRRDRSV